MVSKAARPRLSAECPVEEQKRQTREAAGIDSTEELVEADAVFGVLDEVGSDHVQCRLEYGVQHWRDLNGQWCL
jgi:hypothetical protein